MTPVWNETTAKVIVDPIEDLKLTVSGAYRSDLCDGDVDYTGYNAHADVVYGNFGVDFKPFVDYKTGYYADNAVHEGKRVDTIVGLNVKGGLPSMDSSWKLKQSSLWRSRRRSCSGTGSIVQRLLRPS